MTDDNTSDNSNELTTQELATELRDIADKLEQYDFSLAEAASTGRTVTDGGSETTLAEHIIRATDKLRDESKKLGTPLEDVVDLVDGKTDHSRDDIQGAIDDLAKAGEIYHPDDDYIKLVEIRADGGVVVEDQVDIAEAPDDGDLTRFQLEILFQLSDVGATYGLGLKRALQDYYGEEVNHGRLYPNLDNLVEADLVEKSQLDKRTNQYELTSEGTELVRRHAQQRVDMTDQSGGEN